MVVPSFDTIAFSATSVADDVGRAATAAVRVYKARRRLSDTRKDDTGSVFANLDERSKDFGAGGDSRRSDQNIKDGQPSLELLPRQRSSGGMLTVVSQLLSMRHGSPRLWPVVELGSEHWPTPS